MQIGVLPDRLQPPVLPENWLARPRLSNRIVQLFEQTPIVALVAGPGFGKTLAAAEWMNQQSACLPKPQAQVGWLSFAPDEQDPHSVLLYLRALWLRIGGEQSVSNLNVNLSSLDELLRQGSSAGRWRASADALMNAISTISNPDRACFWVLDDIHHLQDEAASLLDYLLRFRPSCLRLLLTSRRAPDLASWAKLHLTGQLGQVGADELSIQGGDLPQGDGNSRSWPLLWDLQRRGVSKLDPESEDLLQREFWDSLDSEQQELLERCCLLDFLSSQDCGQICPDLPVDSILARLRRQGALIQPWSGEHLRLHPLFGDFLRRRLQRQQHRLQQLQQASAPVLLRHGQLPNGVLHGQKYQLDVEQVAQQLLQQGAFAKLSRWVESLAQPDLSPALRLAYAQALGGSYRFESALHEYSLLTHVLEGAEKGKALLAAAQLLVTTLQPERARNSLKKAYRLLPHAERPQVLQLMAENSLNCGQMRHAQRYRRLAHQQSDQPEKPDLFRLRLLLRTGRISEAQILAEAMSDSSAQEGHRDGQLLLAYLLVVQGQGGAAETLCRRAVREARAKGSVLTEAVAQMRLGHSLQLQSTSNESGPEILNCYSEALALAESTGSDRLKAEALMGRALYFASIGEVAASYQDSLDGLEITQKAGDSWLCAWLRLGVAIAALVGQHPEAAAQLQMAKQQMQQVHDRFGQCLVDLWAAKLEGNNHELAKAAQESQSAGYHFLLERPTLFGPRDQDPITAALTAVGPSQLAPPLRICILGPLRIYRDGQEVPPQAFKRRKARELLGILLAQRGQPISKERLWDLLFPDLDADRAARDLRVVLHALFDVLDPQRPHNHPARWVSRRDDYYSLPWSPELSLDWQDFEKFLALGDSPRNLEQALQLVQGELLADFANSDWAQPLRESWRNSYLLSATRLAQSLLQSNQSERCLALAHSILEYERCWEDGYRLLMQAHLQQGRAAQATLVYDLCREVLQQELGVEPSQQTEELYAKALEG